MKLQSKFMSLNSEKGTWLAQLKNLLSRYLGNFVFTKMLIFFRFDNVSHLITYSITFHNSVNDFVSF